MSNGFGSVATVAVEPWGKDQGNYVEIDEAEYEANKGKYKLYKGKLVEPAPEPTLTQLATEGHANQPHPEAGNEGWAQPPAA